MAKKGYINMTGVIQNRSCGIDHSANEPWPGATWTHVSSDVPGEAEAVLVDRSTAKARFGLWRSEPYEHDYEDYPCDELMVLIDGFVDLIEPDGRERRFGPGEAIFLPKGWCGRWRQEVAAIKYFVMVY